MWIGAGSGNPAPSCGALFAEAPHPFFTWSLNSFLAPLCAMPPYNLPRSSKRLVWSTPRNAYSLLLEEKRRSGVQLFDLTTANPSEALADYPHQELASAFGAITDFRYEPDPLGGKLARQTIAAWYLDQTIPVTAENIALTASTSEGYAILFKLLCDPGDEILIPSPSYPLFEYLARGESVKTVPYQLNYDGAWFIDFESVERAVSPRSKALVVVNPNNPTGSFLKTEEQKHLASLAQKHSLALISDEVFMSYPTTEADQPERVRTLIGKDDVLSFSLNGLLQGHRNASDETRLDCCEWQPKRAGRRTRQTGIAAR